MKKRINWKKKFYNLIEDLELVRNSIVYEIAQRSDKPNVGKKGCSRRLSDLIRFHSEPMNQNNLWYKE